MSTEACWLLIEKMGNKFKEQTKAEEPITVKPVKENKVVRSVANVVSGSFLSKETTLKNLPYIFFLSFLAIHSEYGMTELLSQAYSTGKGIFRTPPWMKVLIRETHDPFSYKGFERTGGINIIDLANINSCSFIATQDLGKLYADERFEVLGRFDHADVRGCNLLVQ